jgi:hypothetical protein
MEFARRKKKHIYCLEGDWEHDLRKKQSIRAMLHLLEDALEIRHVHRHCGTKEELEYRLKQYKTTRYAKYSICYLAFHGEPDFIFLGKNKKVSLTELAEILSDSCKDKIIHFGSCSTLNTNGKNIKRFLRQTQALCVTGYKSDVDFMESTVFDAFLFQTFQSYRKITCVARDMRDNYGELARRLDFRFQNLAREKANGRN